MELSNVAIKKTKLVYYTLIILNLLFLLMVLAVWFLNIPPYKLEKKMAYLVSSVTILLVGILITGGFFFYSRIRRKVAFVDPPDYKLSSFFKASVIQFAFFNLAGNAAIIAFFLTKDLQNLFFFVITLIFLMLNPPGEARLSTEFKYRIKSREVEAPSENEREE